MIGWFKFGDIDTRNYDHIVVCEGEVDSASVRLFDEVVIAGKNGTLLIDTGRYDNVLHSYDIIVHEEYVDSLIQLRNDLQSQTGYKTLIDGFNVGESYIARLDSSFIPKQTRNRNAGTLHIEFSRFPQRYLASGKREKIIGETWENVETVSGDIVQVPNTGYKAIRSLKVALEPIQDLNGYDKPWVGGAGKNKANLADGTRTGQGVTGTVTNQIISASGTATTTYANINHFNEISITSGRNYTVRLSKAVSNAITFRFATDVTDTTYQQVTISAGSTSATFTANNNFTAFRLYISALTSGTAVNISGLQVLVGEGNVSAFEPYSNICPISGRTEVVTQRTGKNLCGISSNASATYTSNGITWTKVDDSTIHVQGTATAQSICALTSDWSKLAHAFLPSGTYRASTDADVNLRIGVGASNTNKGNAKGGFAVTLDTDADVWIGLFVASGTTINKDIHIQLEVGTTATTYEPYQGESYTTDLGRTVYGGTLNLISGVLTVDRAMVDLSTIGATYNSGWNCWVKNTGIDGAKIVTSNTEEMSAIASNMVSAIASGYTSNHNSGTFAQNINGYFFFDNGSTTDPSGQLVYELATPQTYQLTPEQVSLLTGKNNIWSDGEITLTYGDDPYILVNPTPFDAKPLIVVTGSGTFTIEDKTLTVLQGASTFQTIYIDCETMEAWQRVDGGIVSRNDYVQNIDDGFPVLKSGVNNITVGSGIMFLRITPRWWRV